MQRRQEKGGGTHEPAAAGETGLQPSGAGSGGVSPQMATTQANLRLGDMLVREGIITVQQLEKALLQKKEKKGFLGQALVELGFLEQNTLISFLVKQCKIPHLSLLDYDINESVVRLLSEETCLRHRVLPIDKLGRILTVAMVDPLDLVALEEIRSACPDLKIKPILCDWDHYDMVVRRVFGAKSKGVEVYTAESLGLPARKAELPPEPDRETAQAGAAAPAPVHDAKAEPPEAESENVLEALDAEETQATPAPVTTPESAQVPVPEPPAVVETPAAADETVHAEPEHSAEDSAEVVDAVPAVPQDESDAEPEAVPDATPPAEPPARAVPQGMERQIADAVQQAMSSLSHEVAETARRASVQDGHAAADNLTAMLQQTVSNAMQGALAAIQQQPAASPPSTEDLADLIGATVRKALKESVSAAGRPPAQDVAPPRSPVPRPEPPKSGGVDLLNALRQGEGLVPGRGARAGSVPGADVLQGLASAGRMPGQEGQISQQAIEQELPLDPYTFDSFLPGRSNAFPYAVAKAVTERPGLEYNPLYIYGGVGTGKTHLVNAVGNRIVAMHPGKRVRYLSAGRLCRRIAEAVANRRLDQLRGEYVANDVLIVDDIQFLPMHERAQLEFFQIFNAIYEDGGQIVLASDRAPDDLVDLDSHLVSRFSGGVVATLVAPDWQTRVAILRNLAVDADTHVAEEVLALIATRVPNDLRKMCGSLRKVIAFADLVGQDVSCDLATEILNHLGVGEAA